MNNTQKAPKAKKVVVQELDEDAQKVAAYYHWLQRGSPLGDEITDWVSAQKAQAEAQTD